MGKDDYVFDKALDVDQYLYSINGTSTFIAEVKNGGFMSGFLASPFVLMVKEDAEDAAYRIAAAQLTNVCKTAILATLKAQGSKRSQLNSITQLLDSEVGSALVSLLMGVALTYAPGISEHKRASSLAEEFRISGMVIAGDVISEMATSILLPAMMQTIANLPQEELLRVSSSEEETMEETEEASEAFRAVL